MAEGQVRLSVVIPTLNEREHIDDLIRSVMELDAVPKEILIVDAGSTDGTRERVLELAQTDPGIVLVENPDRYVSHGFNRAYAIARGRFIALIGAHAAYPERYFATCIEAIESGECDAAGGFLLQKGRSPMGRAIARAMSSRFGVGDTAFRTVRKRMITESVAFAVYDRAVFEKVGLLDEQLVRNQDDELHYRMAAAGFRMLLIPDLEVTYYVRNSLRRLFSQYSQYGFYKPLVLRKVRSGLRLRHLVPTVFVLYLMTVFLPLLAFFPGAGAAAGWLWAAWAPLAVYVLLVAGVSLGTDAPWGERLRMPLVFPTLHVAYGTGFLRGLPALWKP